MKEGKYAKALAKILVTAIFLITQIYRDLPVWRRHAGAHPYGTNTAAGNQQKHLSLSFATKA